MQEGEQGLAACDADILEAVARVNQKEQAVKFAPDAEARAQAIAELRAERSEHEGLLLARQGWLERIAHAKQVAEAQAYWTARKATESAHDELLDVGDTVAEAGEAFRAALCDLLAKGSAVNQAAASLGKGAAFNEATVRRYVHNLLSQVPLAHNEFERVPSCASLEDALNTDLERWKQNGR